MAKRLDGRCPKYVYSFENMSIEPCCFFLSTQVERALADRAGQAHGLVDRGAGDSESTSKLDAMKEEMDVSRCIIVAVGSVRVMLCKMKFGVQ